MADPKTVPTDASVAAFLAAVPDERRRADAVALCELMEAATGAAPRMWGEAIVGFGQYRYRYATGREGVWPAVGFSPRKTALTVYVAEGFEAHADAVARIGPVTTGRACLYVKRLAAVDADALAGLVGDAFRQVDGKLITS
ncbi:DUF1801 domain-containing protein [Catellatospora tritici]|uniref:DUF1801 domain-containing protein n=1 Tax=Catellatospora tritici TaxID=2851566 RepID=UPI001C2D42FA|nr:DUF1801 domain-containing protein [Catellatospora tritici]MBV1850839.1 DUF1801 domain-containing protein [Catellatospora tritici]MBV1851092.1 DUF1801 domain-containing protein [Catellatospora tritici]